MNKAQLIAAVKTEQNRVGEHQLYPPLEQFSKDELVQRLAELKARP